MKNRMKNVSRGAASAAVASFGAAAAAALWCIVAFVAERSSTTSSAAGQVDDGVPRSVDPTRASPTMAADSMLVAPLTAARAELAPVAPNARAARATARSPVEVTVCGEKFLDASTPTLRLLYFDSGERYYEAPLVDGRRDGVGRCWRRDGTLRSSETFVCGERDGPATYFDEQGNEVGEGSWAEGERVGEWREWWSNGQPRSDGAYKEVATESGVRSVKDGLWRCWRADGAVDESNSGLFVDGERDER